VTDEIGFVYVPLGSSTVQLHDSLGSTRACACSETGFNSQNGDRVCGVNTEEQRSIVRILLAKGLNANDIHKEIFTVYGGKCLSRKTVHNWMANVSLLTKSLKRGYGSG
jgi:hypothetical protein